MTSAAALDEALQRERPRLVALAYRMLGSMADAEDVVQDVFLRVRSAAPPGLSSPAAYLTTATTRRAIDHLRSARVRRESYVGPWLPEPVLDDPAPDVSEAAELADSLSMALLVVLEALTPRERAALLLHDVFGLPHAEVAEALGVTVASSRQLLRRARVHVDARRPRFPVDRGTHAAVVQRFAAACQGGDLDAFLDMLVDDATYTADGGAETKAARRPIRGARRVARFLAYVYGRPHPQRDVAITSLNGEPALAFCVGGELSSVLFVETSADGRATAIYAVRNPAKLAGIGRAGSTPPR